MQIPASRIRQLATPQQYVEAVCSHIARLAFQLAPLDGSDVGQMPEHLDAPSNLPLSSTFALNLAICLPYLAGDASVPAVELPDLLHAVYDVVHGASGCEDLEAAVLAEHQRISRMPLLDAESTTPLAQ